MFFHKKDSRKHPFFLAILFIVFFSCKTYGVSIQDETLASNQIEKTYGDISIVINSSEGSFEAVELPQKDDVENAVFDPLPMILDKNNFTIDILKNGQMISHWNPLISTKIPNGPMSSTIENPNTIKWLRFFVIGSIVVCKVSFTDNNAVVYFLGKYK